MGKLKQAPPGPKFSNGGFSIDGQSAATTTLNDDGINIDYTPSKNEADLYSYSNSLLKEYLPKVNTLSDANKLAMDAQLEAYKQKGIDTIYDTYDPMLTNLKEDVASRFGNLNNSVFFDNLNKIEKQRTQAVKDLSNDVLAKRDELTQNQINQNYDFINQLMGYQDSAFNKALDSINMSMTASELANNFKLSKYQEGVKIHNNNEDIRSAERIALIESGTKLAGGGSV